MSVIFTNEIEEVETPSANLLPLLEFCIMEPDLN